MEKEKSSKITLAWEAAEAPPDPKMTEIANYINELLRRPESPPAPPTTGGRAKTRRRGTRSTRRRRGRGSYRRR